MCVRVCDEKSAWIRSGRGEVPVTAEITDEVMLIAEVGAVPVMFRDRIDSVT